MRAATLNNHDPNWEKRFFTAQLKTTDGGDGMDGQYVTREEFNTAMHKVNQNFTKVEARFDVTDQKIDKLDQKIENRSDLLDQKIDDRFDVLGAKIDALIRVTWWIMGLIGAGLIIPLLTLIIH
ncbi:hypothetical protein [Limosilactobacillus ingluviei]|uniref:hypothetical protein n=1 Tax=Limosilactobacillus ingluviei TaxID=148604 RepID=UPI0024BBE979|nr:hypothetical protein [Limosilactobacillus ingluviei]